MGVRARLARLSPPTSPAGAPRTGRGRTPSLACRGCLARDSPSEVGARGARTAGLGLADRWRAGGAAETLWSDLRHLLFTAFILALLITTPSVLLRKRKAN